MNIPDTVSVVDVITAVGDIAHDVSKFAPPAVAIVASALDAAAPLVASLLKSGAAEAGVTADALEKALEIAMKAASDAQMNAELK